MDFILNVSLLLAGLCTTAKNIILDATEVAFGKNSDSYAAAKELPNEFFMFVVEYAFHNIEQDIREGKLTDSVFLDADLLSKELTHNEIVFAADLTTEPAMMLAVVEGFEMRVKMAENETAPWFQDVMPRLLHMAEHASEVKR